MKINVKDDVLDIVNRIKQIDSSYFIIYDTNKNIYELHCLEQPLSTFCLTLYDKLDERSVNKTLKTRKQNKDALIEEIEKNNAKISSKGGFYASK